jgi:hypothetical protein
VSAAPVGDRTVRARFENTFADLLAADRTFRAIRVSRWIDRGVGLFVIAVGVLGFPLWRWLSVAFVLAGFLTFLDVFPRPFFLWLTHRRTPALQGTWELEADEDGFRYRTPTSDTRTAWSGYTRLVEGPRSFVLLSGGGMVGYVPKRALAPADAERFRQLALDGIVAGQERGT